MRGRLGGGGAVGEAEGVVAVVLAGGGLLVPCGRVVGVGGSVAEEGGEVAGGVVCEVGGCGVQLLGKGGAQQGQAFAGVSGGGVLGEVGGEAGGFGVEGTGGLAGEVVGFGGVEESDGCLTRH